MANTQELERCFLPLDRREPPQPCFVRIIGRFDGLETLLTRYEQLARPCGACFQDGIPNPTEGEISRFYAAVGQQFALDKQLLQRHATLWLGQLRPAARQIFRDALFQSLEFLKGQGCNENILKNAYVKFMCWLRGPLGRVLSALGRAEPPKLLFQGRISKYEVLILHMLHLAGCDVWYVHPATEEFYRKGDPQGQFSQLVQGTPVRDAPRSAPAPRPAPASKSASRTTPAPVRDTLPVPLGPAPWEGVQGARLNTWAAGLSVWDAVLLPPEQRGAGAASRRNVLLAACIGADERTAYRNRLFALRRGLEDSGRTWLLLDRKLPAPTAAQTAPFLQINRRATRAELIRALAQKMRPACRPEDVLFAQWAFVQVMERHPEKDPVRSFNRGARLACWLTEYAGKLFPAAGSQGVPALLYYGPISESELSLLWALANMGADVLWINPDAGAQSGFSKHFLSKDWQQVLFDNTLPLEPFPQREERVRAGTTAYNASRELDQMLHSDTGMFRDRQFARSQPVTLRTTYDEVEQLWREEAQYRPSFQTKSGVVYVPNLFVKISGVDKGELDRYWNQIRSMRTPETYLVTEVPFLKKGPAMNPAQAAAFLHKGRLDPKALKASRFYQYDYLPDDTQDYILEKIQALIDYDLVVDTGPDLPACILSVLMDLDKELLRLLQQFDFTRTIPKFMIVDVTEHLFSLNECILLAFLNLTGFDIAVFTPTGYRNLEKYLRPDSFDTLVVGAFQFDLVVPSLYSGGRGGSRGGGWLDRIFRGG